MTACLFSTAFAAAACVALSVAHASIARADDDASQPKPAPAFELAGDRVIVRRDGAEQTLKVGCVARSFTSQGTRAYVLCGASTIVTIEAEPQPQIVTRQRLVDHVLSLTTIDGVVSARGDAGVKPLDQYAIAPATAEMDEPEVRFVPRKRPRRYGNDDPAQRAKQLHIPPITGFELAATATSGIGFDNIVGAFTTLDTQIIYRFDVPFSIAGYATVGAATGGFDGGQQGIGPRGGDVQVATAEAVVSVDAPVVAVGLGIGTGMLERGYEVEPLFVLRGRIGEIDAFDFRWHMSFATSGRTLIGAFGGSLEFRLTRNWWLGSEAEFGNLRYGRFMLTARRRVIAQRDRKGPTLDLRAGIGIAYVESSSDCNQFAFSNNPQSNGDNECIGTNTDYLGPAVSLGLVFRP